MNFKFIGELIDLVQGIEILSKELDFTIDEKGIPIRIYKTKKNIEVSFKNNEGFIGYNKNIHFFRALGLLIEELKLKQEFNIVEEPQFDSNGAMFDCSRNGVLTVEAIKKIIKKMALMGLNTLMLYNEDIYEIENEPYFGYMRGRYSYDELKECDDYGNIFDIELIPCIQTLAHLTQVLKWNSMSELRDTSDILLVGEEKTYNFIENMIKSAIKPFRTKKIHIGMDEAHNLGLGEYLKKNGYNEKIDIMTKHLEKVLQITEKYELQPMIWSDMYSWNVKENDNLENLVPRNVRLVYWDYYNHFENSYRAHIKKHRKFGSEPIFAGGLWTSMGMVPWYNKTFDTMTKALNACKKEGVKEVFATMWGNNGQEVNVLTAILGLQFFAEEGYTRELNVDKLKQRFKFCTNGEYEAFNDLTLLNNPMGILTPEPYYNSSKCLLWQDLLLGLFDKYFENIDLATYYAILEEKMREYKISNSEWDFIFEFHEKLCKVLKQKGSMGLRIRNYYKNREIDKLKYLTEKELKDLYIDIEELRVTHRKQWFTCYKPFGWEAMDLRYGGLLARIESTVERLVDYIEGRVEAIEELEEERLYFNGEEEDDSIKLPFCNKYDQISSPNVN